MRARKASVRAVEVSSPRVIRLPAWAMLSVVSSAEVGLLIGAEDMRRLGGPGPTAGDAVHQIDQSDIALVQLFDVLGRERQARQRGTGAEFLERWRFHRSSRASACNRHAALTRPKTRSLGLALA